MDKKEMISCIEEMEAVLICLEDRLSKAKMIKTGRKEEVLNLLQAGKISVVDIAKVIGISARNVSSQLTYLRRDGYAIATDSKGRKFIE